MNPYIQTLPRSIYQLFMDDVHCLRHRLNEIANSAIEKAALRNKDVHRIESFNWHDKKFFCEIQVTPIKTSCIVYRVILQDKGFYCIAYNHSQRVTYHFKPHFFERYQQRMHLNMEEAERLMTHYLHQNGSFTTYYRPHRGKRFSACKALFKTGIGYGLYDHNDKIYYFRTFIANETLSFNQKLDSNMDLTPQEMAKELSKKFVVKGK